MSSTILLDERHPNKTHTLDINKIQHLLKKYQENSCTDDECLIVNTWLDENSNGSKIENDAESIETTLSTIKQNIERRIRMKCFKTEENIETRISMLKYSEALLGTAVLVMEDYISN